MLATFIIALAASAAAPAAASAPVPAKSAPADLAQMDPRRMTQAQIRAYNTAYSPKDPAYIRCVKSDDTGSLVRKRFSCRTNAQWEQADRIGNDNARDTYQAMTSKAMTTDQ